MFEKWKKNNLTLVISAVLITIAFVILAALILLRVSSQPQPPSQKNNFEVNNPPEATVNYDQGASGRFYEKATGKRSLSESDSLARKKIIATLEGKSGTLMSSPRV